MPILQGRMLAVCAALSWAAVAGVAAGQGFGAAGAGAPERPATQPYTAEFKITSEQTLANGTTITRVTTEMIALDSQGKRLTVNTTPATAARPERSTYRVYDPVARTNSNWSVPGEKATVTPMPPMPEPGQDGQTCWTASTGVSSGASTTQAPPAPRVDAPGGPYGVGAGGVVPKVENARIEAPKDVREDLGMQTFQGVQAKGTRVTRTTPVGEIGNDAPLVRTTETWRALSFGLIVHEVTDDPQTGKRTREMTQFSNREPYAGSFQPPEGYEIVTQQLQKIACGR